MGFENKEEQEKKGYEERKQEMAGNHVVSKPLPRLSKRVGRKSTTGASKKFTPTRMRNAINRYFRRCEDRDEMPNIKGLMIYLDMNQSMFYTYLKYPEFTDMMEHTRMIISHWAEMDVYATTGRTEGKIAYMKNIHSWTDKLETKNENTQVQLTAEQARARIESLAPRLLEVLHSQETVNQIADKPNEKVVDAEIVENPRSV